MMTAYTLGYVGGWGALVRSPAEMAVTILLATLPGLFIFAAAFAMRQGARLAAEARLTRSLSSALSTPAAVAAARTGDIMGALRQEIDRAATAASTAHDRLQAMREALAADTERLTETAADAQRTARVVGETLTRERDAVASLLADLNAGAAGLAEGVERQNRLVAQASDLARSQLQEAQAGLAAGAAGLAGAGAEVSTAAERASDTLAHQAERLDVAAAALSERLRFLDARLTEQRGGISALARSLAADEDSMAARLDARGAQLEALLAESRTGAEELNQAVEDGGSALRGLVQVAADQVRDLSDEVRASRAALAAEARAGEAEAEDRLRESLGALDQVAQVAQARLQDGATAVQAAADLHVAAARTQVEQLGQAVYDAGQRANQAFDARIGEARRLIEQAAAMVDESGQRAVERVAASAQASRAAIEALGGTVEALDARIAHLPDTAAHQIEGLRATVEQGLGELIAAARKASEETQAIDQAFQDRIRRNYETLSDAVKLMSRVAGAVDLGQTEARAAPLSAPPPTAEPPAPTPAHFASVRWSAPVAAPPPPAVDADDPPGLRPRLKFTPTAADQALKAVFEPSARPETARASPRSGGEPDGWTWKDLLTTMEDTPTDADGLGEHMVRQLQELGLDAAALLPPARVEELARAQLAGDPSAARDTLRRIAPAAVRRLSRRVLSERDLREQSDRFVARYRDLLREAAAQEGGLRTAMTLMATDSGRAFLLLDAAVGDL